MALYSTAARGPARAIESWLMKGRDALGQHTDSASPNAPPTKKPTASPSVVHMLSVAVARSEKPSSYGAHNTFKTCLVEIVAP